MKGSAVLYNEDRLLIPILNDLRSFFKDLRETKNQRRAAKR